MQVSLYLLVYQNLIYHMPRLAIIHYSPDPTNSFVIKKDQVICVLMSFKSEFITLL
jgi:hypothetical protein